MIGRRLDRLSEQTNDALRVAAVIGRDFDDELVSRVAKQSQEELMRAAGEAIAERLVTDVGRGRYSFAHALVRDTLYEELSPPKRSALHERTGVAIEEICGGNVEERLGELAHHFLAAAPRGDLAKAIDYAKQAGAQDMEQLAYEDAVDVYEPGARGARADGGARRGAPLPAPALPRRRRGEVRAGGGRPRCVRAGGGVGPPAGRHRLPGGRRDRDRNAERRGPARRTAPRPARRGPGEDRTGAHAPGGRRCSAPSQPSSTGSTTTSPSPSGW